MKRTPLTAMLTLLAVLATHLRGRRVRRQSGELVLEPATQPHDHDDHAQAQVQTGLLTAVRAPRPLAGEPRAWPSPRPPGAGERGGVADRLQRSARCRARGRPSRAPARPRRRTSRAGSSSFRSRSPGIVACAASDPGCSPASTRQEDTPVAPFQLACTIVSSPVLLRLGEHRRRARRAPAPGEAEGAVEGHVERLMGVEQQRAVVARTR